MRISVFRFKTLLFWTIGFYLCFASTVQAQELSLRGGGIIVFHLEMEKSSNSNVLDSFQQRTKHPSIAHFYENINNGWFLDARVTLSKKTIGIKPFLGIRYSSETLNNKEDINDVLGAKLNSKRYSLLVGLQKKYSSIALFLGINLGIRQYKGASVVAFENGEILKGRYNYKNSKEYGILAGLQVAIKSGFSIGMELDINYGFARRDEVYFVPSNGEKYVFNPIGDREIEDLLSALRFNLIYSLNLW